MCQSKNLNSEYEFGVLRSIVVGTLYEVADLLTN